jgi:hypothetical protein
MHGSSYSTNTYTRQRPHTPIHAQSHTPQFTRNHTHTHTHQYTHNHTHTYTHTYMHIHTHIHAHTGEHGSKSPGIVIPTPDLFSYAIHTNSEFLILASDGVWDKVRARVWVGGWVGGCVFACVCICLFIYMDVIVQRQALLVAKEF